MAPLDAIALAVDPDNGVRAESAALNARYPDLTAHAAVELGVRELFPGKISLVSSFGAESAVLLHILSEVDNTVPVIFLDTGRLFAETLEYRTKLAETLGLQDVRTVTPDPDRLAAEDPHRALWMTNPDHCCHVRKTEPLQRAVKDFDAWFTGRKRFQNAKRAALQLFEAEGERIKINPLIEWSPDDLKAYAAKHALPPHPLVAKGYPSIGCVPCTSRVAANEDQRSGRWRGLDKTECGIHEPTFGTDGGGI
ncbi:phosphoadenylyl-sulfate reductase [Bauldia sp.]|uniref:phosphoadenylyl-sulfate reductase n=1 Tax=Bauldia sp. TaxID=2575872 RepID=UPI003BAB5EC1